MGNADVESLAITCVDRVHSVGGMVSGLEPGDTIELANGTDTVTLNASGSFEFDAKVVEGAAYSVSVKSAPVTSSKCKVKNGASTMGSSNVSNVTVSCRKPPTAAACDTGLDPVDPSLDWVVCSATPDRAVLSRGSTWGIFHVVQICQSLGYSSVGARHGSWGNTCTTEQYESSASCSSNGTINLTTYPETSDPSFTYAYQPVWECLF